MTQARVSFTQPLPISMVPKLEAVPGVARVAYSMWFGGVWQENTPLFVFAIDPLRHHDVYPEYVMPEQQWQAFAHTRTGMIAGKHAGGSVRLEGRRRRSRSPPTSIRRRTAARPGRSTWWASSTARTRRGSKQTNIAFINADYFDEANQFGIRDAPTSSSSSSPTASRRQAVSKTIDAMFENSPDETKTQTEKDFNLGFVKQIGDIGLIVHWILFAVFFTLLLVVGNTMAQSVRERIPELAVLKTLGFSDGSVLGFVLAEAFALCLCGGLVGLVLATALARWWRRARAASSSCSWTAAYG